MLDATIIPATSITLSEPAIQPNVDQIRNGPLIVPADITTFTVTIDLPGDIQLGSINLGSFTNVKAFEVNIRKPTDTQPVLYKVTKFIICKLILNLLIYFNVGFGKVKQLRYYVNEYV